MVTIDGESAGGASVVMQIVAYGGAKPVPFKRGIAQSIGYGPVPTSDEIAETFSRCLSLPAVEKAHLNPSLENVTQAAGCPSSGSEAMTCLREASLGIFIRLYISESFH